MVKYINDYSIINYFYLLLLTDTGNNYDLGILILKKSTINEIKTTLMSIKIVKLDFSLIILY